MAKLFLHRLCSDTDSARESRRPAVVQAWHTARRFSPSAFRAEVGQTIVLAALALPVILGFTGVSIDVGMVMLHRTERQRAADAAALAGAQYLYFHSYQATAAKQAACQYAQMNGFGNGVCPNSEVEVDSPPTTGPNAGDATAVEVRIKRTDATFFMRILGIDTATVTARAVGGGTPFSRQYALVVLNQTVCNAYNHSSSSGITIYGAGVIVNSDGTAAGQACSAGSSVSAQQSGGSTLTAQDCKNLSGESIPCFIDHYFKGKWVLANNSTASPSPTKAPRFLDPLSCGPPLGSQAAEYCPRPVPCSNSIGTSPANCVPWSATSAGVGNKANNPTITQLTGSGDVVLLPGTYFGGIRVNSASQTVRFTPGIYVLAGGDHNGNGGGFNYQSGNLCGLAVAGNPCPVATGVTFFNTGNPYANQATNRLCQGVSLTGSGTLRFAAPTIPHTTVLTGYKNMLFWQDDSCTAEFKYAGSSSGTSWTQSGIMYLPKATLNVTGGGSFGAVQMIVDKFIFSGSQGMTINFTRYVDTDTQYYKLLE